MQIHAADWVAILPALTLIAAGIAAVATDVFRTAEDDRWPLTALSGLGVAGAVGLLLRHLLTGAPTVTAFGGSIIADDLSVLLSLAIAVATGLLIVMSQRDLERRGVDGGEYHGLVLMCAASMLMLVAANDLVMVFLNLEIMSLALYVLTGITRKNPRSNEAAVKYLINGGFATGFLLFGMTLLYGVTGSLSLPELGAALGGSDSPLVVPGLALLAIGLAFKVGAAPFHMWVPDVYEGAPTSLTAFMSVAVKAAGFGVLVRISFIALDARPELWGSLLWWLAVLTMVVGNLLALHQDSVKRMLAYSGIAHTGYALVGLASMVGTDGGVSVNGAAAVVFYLLVYTLMTLGAFAFLVYIGHEVERPERGRPEWQDGEHIEDLSGLGQRRPRAALAMTVLLVSLSGIPPTAGFIGKFLLFEAAVVQGHVVLAVIGVLASLVSLYYYLRPVVHMWMRPPAHTDDLPHPSVGLVVGVTAIAVVVIGLQPTLLIHWAMRSIALFG